MYRRGKACSPRPLKAEQSRPGEGGGFLILPTFFNRVTCVWCVQANIIQISLVNIRFIARSLEVKCNRPVIQLVLLILIKGNVIKKSLCHGGNRWFSFSEPFQFPGICMPIRFMGIGRACDKPRHWLGAATVQDARQPSYQCHRIVF